MSDKNLLIRDTTYPHLYDSQKSSDVVMSKHKYQTMLHWIEQLERELAEAQKNDSRYAWATRNSLYFNVLCNGFKDIDDAIDECIAEEKK